MMPARPPTASLLRLVTLPAPVLLAACQSSVLDPAGAVGFAERSILLDSLVIMLAIVVPTIAATLGFAWWFRRTNPRAKYDPAWTYSGKVELVTWGVPLLTIMLLGGVTWVGAHELDPYRPLRSGEAPLEVQVVSLDWKWLFIYPGEGVASANELVIPAGRPVHFTLTSSSVWNSFFVPRLGSMIYTMNGMRTQLNLVADRPGTYPGLSTHFSGDGFSDMHFDVRALPAADFANWTTATRGAGTALDAAAYARLEHQGTLPRPVAFGTVQPGLFDAVADLRIAPAPGPPDPTPVPSASTRSLERP